MKYTIKQVKKEFLNFFEKNGHTIIKNSSIIPENDDSLLFINAGMAPIKNVFTGQEQPDSKRMCNLQICIRTNDIDSIGDRHHLSSFCMLGSWSVGDYFKKEAVAFAYDLLVNHLKIPKEKLYATVFGGDKTRGLPADTDSGNFWQDMGIAKNHILNCSFEDNFWRMGDGESPCGPCTEVFYDTGDKHGKSYEETGYFDDKKRYIEIWNAGVFMQYLQTEKGTYEKLPFNSVDTGSGIERLVMTLNGYESVYQTEVYAPIINHILANSDKAKDESVRIISDHIKTSVLILNAGIEPSNVKRGYVLRRLLRRAMRHLRNINAKEGLLEELVAKTIDNLIECDIAPEWNYSKDQIVEKVKLEQEKFSKLLENGLKVFEEFVSNKNNITDGKLNSNLVFKLYDTFGFPFEITKELANEHNLSVSEKEFEELFAEHKENSKGDVGKVFKSGLADINDNTIKLHTATHLLHAGLKKFLGQNVNQKGSNITPERLRFDFNFERKMTAEEVQAVEDFVNNIINQKIEICREEMPYDLAKESGAVGLFSSKYGENVSVYTIGSFSKEICSGPHAKNTKDLGRFKITKEESSSAGIRRIKAVLQ
ncbi:MAG: alanine--tRNA ligase [Clostridia bacterium]|nr:alanine--tRNA ligase [Clostridia bacterium]